MTEKNLCLGFWEIYFKWR